MDRGCPRKANGPRMPKEKEMGQRSPQAMQWVKKAQDGMGINSMAILGHCNQLREEHAAGPKEAQQARVK